MIEPKKNVGIVKILNVVYKQILTDKNTSKI
jgi:hypothetical protein